MIRAFVFLALCAVALGNVIRFNAGGAAVPSIGFRAEPTTYRSAGSAGFTANNPLIINGGSWSPIYESHAFSVNTDLVYTFPVPSGDYNVFLLFAETWGDAVVGTREFSVAINGDVKRTNLDVVKEAGGLRKPLFLPYFVTVTNNVLTISLGKITGKNNPMISGIILTGINGVDPKTFIDGTAPVPTVSVVTPTPSASSTASPSTSSALASSSPSVSSVPSVSVSASASTTSVPSVSVSASASTTSVPVPSVSVTPSSSSLSASSTPSVSSVPSASVSASTSVSVSASASAAVSTSASPSTLITPSASISAGSSGINVGEPVSGSCIPLDVLINVGGSAVGTYAADNVALISGSAGATYSSAAAIDVTGSDTAPAAVYNSERFVQNPIASLTYNIPTNGNGPVTVVTHHAELFFNSANSRVTGISINGVQRVAGLDVFAQVGKNKAFANVLPNEVPQTGSIAVSFTRNVQNPQVNAIRVFRTCVGLTVSVTPSASSSVASVPSVTPSVSSSATSVPVTPSASSSVASVPSVTASASSSVAPVPSITPSVSAVVAVVAPGCVTGRTTDSFSMNIGSATAVGDYAGENTAYISGPQGVVYNPPSTVAVDTANTAPAGVYDFERFTFAGSLSYKIPVSGAGPFTVTTLHAETFVSAVGGRLFNININGVLKKTSLDIFSEVGKNVALPQVFPNITPVNGEITITLVKVGAENPQINAIKISGVGADGVAIGAGCTPSGVATITPSSSASASSLPSFSSFPDVSASVSPVAPSPGLCGTATTVTGRIDANKFAMNIGGGAVAALGYAGENTNYISSTDKGVTSAVTTNLVTGSEAALYANNRFTQAAALTYKFPMPTGTYSVTLHHAETFADGPDVRVFDITINGVLVNQNFDLFTYTGKNQAFKMTYPNIPSVNGEITISLVDKKNNPFINAILFEGAGAGTLAIGGKEDGTC